MSPIAVNELSSEENDSKAVTGDRGSWGTSELRAASSSKKRSVSMSAGSASSRARASSSTHHFPHLRWAENGGCMLPSVRRHPRHRDARKRSLGLARNHDQKTRLAGVWGR